MFLVFFMLLGFAEIQPNHAESAVIPPPIRVPIDAYQEVSGNNSVLKIGNCIQTTDSNGQLRECPPSANQVKFVNDSTVFVNSVHYSVNLQKLEKSSNTNKKSIANAGVGVSLCGLVGASVQVNSRKQTRTTAKSISLMATLDAKFGYDRISLEEVIGELPSELETHYYVSQVEHSSWDILKAEAIFSSRQSMSETTVSVKLKILFFSFSKTFKFLSESNSSNFHIEISHTSNRPGFVPFKQSYGEQLSNSLDAGINKLAELEAAFQNLPKEFQKSNAVTKAAYIVMPYSSLIITNPMPSTVIPKNDVSNFYYDEIIDIKDQSEEIQDSLEQLSNLQESICSADNKQNISDATASDLQTMANTLNPFFNQFYSSTNDAVKKSAENILAQYQGRVAVRTFNNRILKLCPSALDYLG